MVRFPMCVKLAYCARRVGGVMSDYEHNERTKHRFRYWLKQIVCIFVGHDWYAPYSWIRYCQSCLKTEDSDDHEF